MLLTSLKVRYLRFKTALISGTNTKLEQDPLFQTWKHYTQSVLDAEPTFKTTKAPDTPDQPALATRLSKPSTSTSANSSAVSIANEMFPIPKPKSKSRAEKGNQTIWKKAWCCAWRNKKKQNWQICCEMNTREQFIRMSLSAVVIVQQYLF